VNEHVLAAGEFANAAQHTSSVEALRTLRLLEEHHRRLAELLKLPAERTDPDSASEKQGAPPSLSKDGSSASTGSGDDTLQKGDKNDADSGGATASGAAKVPSLSQQQRPARNLTSSIASNLASARGIRSKYRAQGQPLSPSVSNDPASGNLEVLPRRESSRGKMQNMLDPASGSPKPSWAPPDALPRTAPSSSGRTKEQQRSSPAGEEGYSRFYNQIGTFLGRLPAPLAFTGLPLISEESTLGEESTKADQTPPPPAQTQSSPKRNRLRQQPSSTASSDELSKYFSRPALRAIEHRSASDSFYVVPTSGHTMSYANILTFADKEKRRLEASSLHSGSASIEDEEDFVDAYESPTAMHSQPSQLSAPARRRVGKTRSEKDLHNAIEELCMENGSLKEMIDKLSKRLQAFEASSQRLAESRIMAPPGSPGITTSPGGVPSGSGSQEALRRAQIELEEKWNAAQQKVETLEKENDKMQRTLVKYRQKWDSLKESAKARRAHPPAGETAAQS
jgi:hypothetical protein